MPTAEAPPAPRERRAGRRWAWGGLAVVLAGRARAAAVGRPAGPALRLQHRRERPLRPARGADVRAGTLDPHYFANPPAFTYVAALPAGALVRRRRRRRARVLRSTRASCTRSRASRRAVLGDARAVAALPGRCAPVRARGRPAGGGDRGGRLPAGLLRPPRAQRRADARAADAVAAGQRGRAAQRPPARPPARGHRARARLRDQVHGGDRAAPARRGGARAPSGRQGPRAGRARSAGWRCSARPRWRRS